MRLFRPWLGRTAGAIAAGLLLVAAPAAAQQSSARYENAEVICDEASFCVAVVRSLDANGEARSVLQLRRGPEPRSRWQIAISTLADLADRDRPVSLSVDNGVGITLRPASDYAPFVNPRDFFVLSQFALDRLMVDLQVGYVLRFAYIDIAGGPHTDVFRLDGLTAALNDIDRRQKRVARDRRSGPPEDLPPAPPVDKQALVALDGLPPRLVEWHLAFECEAPDSPSLKDVDPVIGALSDTAMLYAIPCFRSNDRTGYRLYLVESGEIGGMHALTFATFSSRFGWMGADTLEDVRYDEKTRTLTALDLGEGGGCGWSGTWVFDEYAFRLAGMRVHEGCGSPKPPEAWTEVYPGTRSQ